MVYRGCRVLRLRAIPAFVEKLVQEARAAAGCDLFFKFLDLDCDLILIADVSIHMPTPLGYLQAVLPVLIG